MGELTSTDQLTRAASDYNQRRLEKYLEEHGERNASNPDRLVIAQESIARARDRRKSDELEEKRRKEMERERRALVLDEQRREAASRQRVYLPREKCQYINQTHREEDEFDESQSLVTQHPVSRSGRVRKATIPYSNR